MARKKNQGWVFNMLPHAGFRNKLLAITSWLFGITDIFSCFQKDLLLLWKDQIIRTSKHINSMINTLFGIISSLFGIYNILFVISKHRMFGIINRLFGITGTYHRFWKWGGGWRADSWLATPPPQNPQNHES